MKNLEYKSSRITSFTNGHTSILNVRAFLFSIPLLIRSYLLRHYLETGLMCSFEYGTR